VVSFRYHMLRIVTITRVNRSEKRGDYVSAATDELSLEPAAVHKPYGEITPDPGIASATFDAVLQQGSRDHDFQRPAWLSPGIVGWVVGALDFCLVLTAAAAAFAAYSGIMSQTIAEPGRHILTSFLAATLFVGMFERLGGYRSKRLSRLYWQLTHILITWGLTVAVLLLAAFFSKTSETYSRGWVLTWIITAPVLLLTGRSVFHAAMATRTGGGYLARNVAIIGAGNEGQRLIARLLAGQDGSVVIRGVFDDRKSRLPGSVCGLPVRGTTDDLLRFARDAPIDEVVIALPLDAEHRLRSLCDKMKTLAIDVRLSLEPLAETFRVRGLSYVGEVPVLEVVDRPLKNWRAAAKWIEDKLLGLFLLVLIGPLMVLIAILIKLDSSGPVFFVQKRFGFNNEVIRVLKFRTMQVDRGDPSGAQRTVRNDPRVTRLGRILRWLSFDELPQLINVVRGDMSLVGPRAHPIAMKAGDRLYCEAVEQYLHRHRVKPGITGWAQVNGLRGEVDTLEKANARVMHDLYYIEHWSPWLDLTILLKTAGILASRENAY
jgi:Undecaprenyl-phosphate glucose phosphotransferase